MFESNDGLFESKDWMFDSNDCMFESKDGMFEFWHEIRFIRTEGSSDRNKAFSLTTPESDPQPGIEPGPHWWEADVLTTRPPEYPLFFSLLSSLSSLFSLLSSLFPYFVASLYFSFVITWSSVVGVRSAVSVVGLTCLLVMDVNIVTWWFMKLDMQLASGTNRVVLTGIVTCRFSKKTSYPVRVLN